MPKPRPSVRALIIRDAQLLVTVNRHVTDPYLLLPGGGQEFGESMAEAAARECLEELGVEVEVGDIAYLRDYIGSRHEFAQWDSHFHGIETVFYCTLTAGAVPSMPEVGDRYQVGVDWLSLDDLDGAPLFPACLKSWLHLDEDERPRYLGAVN